MSNTSAVAEGGSKKRGRKWVIIVAAVVVLAAAAGTAAQFLLRSDGAAAAGNEAGARAKKVNPVFVSLDQFTVNLADEGGERFAQIAVTLEVANEQVDKAIHARMPSIRNAVLLLISSKKADDLLSLDGKKALAEEIALRAGAELGWQPSGAPEGGSADPQGTEAGARAPAASDRKNPIEAVHFSNFIVQ